MNNKIGKKEMIEMISDRVSKVSKTQIGVIYDTVFELIVDAMAQGTPVGINKFGTFKPVYQEAREARNPKTGEKIPVPAKHVPKMSFAKDVKERLK